MNPFLRKALWALYPLIIALLRVLYRLSWALYNFSGLRHIVEMTRPRRPNAPDYEKPPTFFLWVIGLYVGLFGIAATHYEAALDRIENRMGALASQLATGDEETFKRLIERIPEIRAMKTPLKPDLLYPFRGHSPGSYLSCQEEGQALRQYFVLCSFLVLRLALFRG